MNNNKNYEEEMKKLIEKENISFLKTLIKLKEKSNNNIKNNINNNEFKENFNKNNFDYKNLIIENNEQNIFENQNIKNLNQIPSPINKNENNFIQTPKSIKYIKNDLNVLKSTNKKISNKKLTSEQLATKKELDSNIYIKDLLDGIGPISNSSRPPSNHKIIKYNINNINKNNNNNNNNNKSNDMKKLIVGNNSISSIESIGSKNEIQNGHILDIKLNNKEKSDFLSFNLNNTPSKNSINNEFNNNINNYNNKKDNININNNKIIDNNNINKQKKKNIVNINYFNTKKNIELIDKLIKESKKDEENLILNPMIENNNNNKKEKTIFDLYDIHSNQILKNEKKNTNKSYNNNGRIYFKEKEKSYLNDAKIKINNFYKNNFFYQKNLNKGHSNSYEVNNKYYTNFTTKKDYIINKITNKKNNNKIYNSSKKNKNLSPFSQKIKINIKNKSQNKNNNNNNINKIKTNYIKSIKLYFVKKNE